MLSHATDWHRAPTGRELWKSLAFPAPGPVEVEEDWVLPQGRTLLLFHPFLALWTASLNLKLAPEGLKIVACWQASSCEKGASFGYFQAGRG